MKIPVRREPASDATPGCLAPELVQLSQWMDAVFRVPGVGWRFGLDALLGLVPWAGDTVTSLVSLYILAAAARYRVPRVTLIRMALNIILDVIIGALPVVGDLFDVWWKSNVRNVALLERHVQQGMTSRRATWGDGLFVGLIGVVVLLLLAGSFVMAYLLLRGLGSLLSPWNG
jgi:hypothetical protein